MSQPRERLALRHTLEGHRGWVTSIATSTAAPELLLSASRDKTLLIWQITRDSDQYAIPRRALTGHNHFVQEVSLSSNGMYAVSASWDKTLRLWDLTGSKPCRRFVGHTNDVLSVSVSADNRIIVSGSRDKTIKLWNSDGENMLNIDGAHTEWVSCVRFSPNVVSPVIVSAGWDKLVKVWDLASTKLRTNHIGHKGYINSLAVSPDGSLCASGGKDGIPMLWDLNEGKHLYSLDVGEEIHALCFSPNRYWLCAATSLGIRIWDLQTKEHVDTVVVEDDEDFDISETTTKKSVPPTPLSLAWSPDGQTLFAGYSDNKIRVWDLVAY